MKERITFEAKYKKGAMMLNQDSLPRLRHIPSTYLVKETQILASGEVLLNGEHREFQDIRVYLKDSAWIDKTG